MKRYRGLQSGTESRVSNALLHAFMKCLLVVICRLLDIEHEYTKGQSTGLGPSPVKVTVLKDR